MQKEAHSLLEFSDFILFEKTFFGGKLRIVLVYSLVGVP